MIAYRNKQLDFNNTPGTLNKEVIAYRNKQLVFIPYDAPDEERNNSRNGGNTMKRFLLALAIVVSLVLVFPVSAYSAPPTTPPGIVTVEAGTTWVVTETTHLNVLTIEEGANIVAPPGKSVTMTVHGVETGQALVKTAGVDTAFVPGTYWGNIVLTVTDANIVEYAGAGPPPPGGATALSDPPPTAYEFPFRQALYLDETGIVQSKSVLAAVIGKKPAAFNIKDILISSTGECFDGIFAANGTWTVTNAKIDLTGNGRSDFVGYGAAVVGRGEDTTLVLDKACIITEGVARTAVVADKGSNVIVKNSYLQTMNGVLPADYMPTIDTTQMRSVPWMLSLSGNCRATNLLGTNTKAAYINSYIGAEGWGVLSTDGCTTPILTAINSKIAITGEDGYGSYGIGGATERFLGCEFDVATYATISRGSFLYYGDSDPAVVAALNTALNLGLTDKELASLVEKPTIVNSDRFGIMWHGGGTLDVSGGTIFNTGETTFLDKGQAIAITVDGSEGAQLNPGNGVIMQVMDDDDPGPQPPFMYNTGIYDEPTGPVIVQPGHDIYTAGASDALATFSNIELNGDFYNGMRGDIPGPFGPPSPRNLGLTFDNASITGVISASTATHLLPHIEYPIGWDGSAPFINVGHTEDYKMLGEVTNTPSQVVNNGVIVVLNSGSTWTVTGTSYLSKLTIAADATIIAPEGYTVAMTVNGAPTDIIPGNTYTGNIMLTLVAD